MPTPCNLDNRFIGTLAEMTEAATECAGCPVFLQCHELGLGEDDGVYAGLLPDDPIRVEHREANAGNKMVTCPSGHPYVDYGVLLPGQGRNRVQGCRRCADLRKYVATFDAANPHPLPETEAREPDTIRHGTDAGYKAHWRRKEPACAGCLRAHRVARARYELAALEREEEAS